jgi:hypothetical protein
LFFGEKITNSGLLGCSVNVAMIWKEDRKYEKENKL